MQARRKILWLFLGGVFALMLSGCEDVFTSALPDPSVEISQAPGETITLGVTGPVPGLRFIKSSVMGEVAVGWYELVTYTWTVSYDGGLSETVVKRGSPALKFTLPAEVNTNKIKITCWFGRMEYAYQPFDTCTWTIRVGGAAASNGHGCYIIENQADIRALQATSSIAGDLIINRSTLMSLQGLEQLSSVGGELVIRVNPQLASLEGLRNLSEAGALDISHNAALASLGLDALSRVQGSLRILSNTALCTSQAEALRDQVLSRSGIGAEITIDNNMNCTTP